MHKLARFSAAVAIATSTLITGCGGDEELYADPVPPGVSLKPAPTSPTPGGLALPGTMEADTDTDADLAVNPIPDEAAAAPGTAVAPDSM